MRGLQPPTPRHQQLQEPPKLQQACSWDPSRHHARRAGPHHRLPLRRQLSRATVVPRPYASTQSSDQEQSAEATLFPRSESYPQDPEVPEADEGPEPHPQDPEGPMVLDTPATSVHSSGTTGGNRHYSARGTMGTVRGKRPPKDPVKLEKFMKAKAAYAKEKIELQQ